MTKVSVIIPTRNRPEFLSEAVASVLRQREAEFELIIVNDGTEHLQEFSDPRIRVLNSSEQGAVVARNNGVDAARGDMIAFLDDDDVWTATDHLAQAAYSNSEFFFADGFMKFPNGEAKLFARDANASSLRIDNTILVSAVCYRKSLHAKLGVFDVQLPYYWDWDWYLRIAQSGVRMQRRAEAVVDIRVHPQNMSGGANGAVRQKNLSQFCRKHNLQSIDLKSHLDFV